MLCWKEGGRWQKRATERCRGHDHIANLTNKAMELQVTEYAKAINPAFYTLTHTQGQGGC